MSQPGQVTQLLRRFQQGDRRALEEVYPLVYDELRVAARRALAREREGLTLQATELVHEAFFKLVGADGVAWQGRAHFIAIASRAIRQILVDHARRVQAEKRGGGVEHVTLGDAESPFTVPAEEMLALDDALERLSQLEPRLRTVVEYRFFGGLSEREIAEVLGLSERTVQRDWIKARAWLHKEIYPVSGSAS
ncbi:MAG TPA: sigma-70 family RNA polymerase sigma factor [Gemmatimonadaceae bacterium]|nr:sigma-70 family RNA polymerase sigma factor [Gemmatimonadaceae bacterium]